MDFDNIIYIIAIAAWLLYSFFGKKKKQERKAPAENFPMPAAETPAPATTGTPAEPVSRRMSKKKTGSGKTIFEEIISTLEGDIPVETVFSEEETSSPEPASKTKGEQQKIKAKTFPEKYDTLEKIESLEVYPEAESLEDLYKKERQVKIASPRTKPAQQKPATVKEAEPYIFHTPDWRDAFVYSEIIGRPRAVVPYEYSG